MNSSTGGNFRRRKLATIRDSCWELRAKMQVQFILVAIAHGWKHPGLLGNKYQQAPILNGKGKHTKPLHRFNREDNTMGLDKLGDRDWDES